MRKEIFLSILSAFVILGLQTGCAANNESNGYLTPAPPASPPSEAYIPTSSPLVVGGPSQPSNRLSRFFLVEQPSAVISNVLVEAFRKDPPGGLVFWNFSKGTWKDLAKTTSRYSAILKENGHLPAFFSIDYEGGGLNFSPSGANIAGIQRFRAGFTDIVHGAWLGKSLPRYGTELCELHGRIMGLELAAAGVNYPLTLVSDLAQRLFVLRGVSTDPAQISLCLSSFTKAMAAAGPVVAVTKHYPGLGQNAGDTHDVESVSTAKILADSDRNFAPFRDLISFVNANGLQSRLSIMSSHGKFPLIDPNHLTTESPTLLEGILRDKFGFQGVRVSDAMWMGGYGTLQGDALYAVYLNAFNSGLDMLMIPGGRFGGALKAFQQVASDTASPSLRAAVESRSKQSFQTFRDSFNRRVIESLARIDGTLKTLPYAQDTVSGSAPTMLTIKERARYYAILRELDPRWATHLPTAISSP